MTIAGSNMEFLPSERCYLCPVRNMALFANLKPEDLLKMNFPIQYETITKGSKLYEHDEEAGFIYTLQNGVLKLVQYLPTGEERIVRLLRRGDLAGIEAVTAANYQHDAIAMTTLTICKIPADKVLEFSIKIPELHANLLEKWQFALMTSDTWLTKLSTGPSSHRVVRLLIWLAENQSAQVFYMPGRKDIGNMLSLTTETVSRIIAGMRRDGDLELLGVDRARVDIAALKKTINEAA